jgi:hypothetical protein
MAKKGTSNRNNQNRPQAGRPNNSATAPAGTAAPTPLTILVDESLSVASDESINIDVVDTSAGDDISPDDLRRAAALYEAAATAARTRESSASRRESDIEARELELREEKTRLNEEKRAITDDKQRNGNDRAELERRLKALEAREQDLLDREVEAERRATEQTAETLKRAHEEILAPLVDARAQIVEDARQQLIEQLTKLSEHATDLDRRQAQLDADEHRVSNLSLRLDEDRFDWEQERESLESAAVEELTRKVQRDDRRMVRLQQELDRLKDMESAVSEIGSTLGTDPTIVLEDLERLRARVRELETELRHRPSETVGEELNLERVRVSVLEAELGTIRSDNERLKGEISSTQTLALERDRLTRENSALYEATAAYEKRVEELTRKFNNLVTQSSDRPPFPECTAMDSRASLQAAPTNLHKKPVALDRLVAHLQLAMANRPSESGPPLYFGLDDLRIFLGGMAMSRLHILEGVSGTGKTSLPIAVAQALGGGYAKIEVQAGWRDNRDLLGYYNDFEKHFREHEFTRSLYEALTPRHRSGLYFVVLDEMNLSKPEQYFADYLSLLEDREGADRSTTPSVMLNDQSIAPLPANMREPNRGGVELPLGDNVWFIGTANHDETTASFAPKTQSRAHMMELPKKLPDSSEITSDPESYKQFGKTLSYEALLKQFDEASIEHQSAASEAEGFFRSILDLLEDFDDELSWGPRINRQIGRFVPTVVATGGSVGLAVDHLLYTKLTRRLRDSFSPDMRNGRKELLKKIQEQWPCEVFGAQNSKAIRDLERQISRP